MKNPYVETLKPVWKNLDYVFVDEGKLSDLIERMRNEKLEIPAWAVPNVHPVLNCDPEFFIDFISWICTVNFAFTNFTWPHKKFTIEYPPGSKWEGAFALEACFMRAHNEGISVFNAEYMKEISRKDVEYIFRAINEEHHGIPLLAKRREIFHEVGRVLLEKYKGRWINLFKAGSWRAFNKGNGIVERLVADFPSFRDTRYYKGHILEFHKRAQLLVMMYHGRAVNSNNLRLIKDIQDIGPICDYDVPKALEFRGVLKYRPALKDAIDGHQIIYPYQSWETENRLATAHSMVRICDDLDTTMLPVDAYVWFMGKESPKPHMLVPTTDY